MPARDFIHDAVRNALIKDGWTITHDPYRLPIGFSQLLVDLGAERFVSAQRNEMKIAVEIKNLSGRSPIHELEQAIGQYILYQVTQLAIPLHLISATEKAQNRSSRSWDTSNRWTICGLTRNLIVIDR